MKSDSQEELASATATEPEDYQQHINSLAYRTIIYCQSFSLARKKPSDQEKKICKFLSKSKQMYEAIEYLLVNRSDRKLPSGEDEISNEEIQ